MKFLSPEVALYLYKSTIRPCMENCCHVWAGAPNCYLELLDNLQKWIWRTVGPSLAASLQPLAHRRNVASLSLFYRYYFGRFSSELAQLVPLPFFHGRSTGYSDRLYEFSVTIPRCYKQGCQFSGYFRNFGYFFKNIHIPDFVSLLFILIEKFTRTYLDFLINCKQHKTNAYACYWILFFIVWITYNLLA